MDVVSMADTDNLYIFIDIISRQGIHAFLELKEFIALCSLTNELYTITTEFRLQYKEIYLEVTQYLKECIHYKSYNTSPEKRECFLRRGLFFLNRE